MLLLDLERLADALLYVVCLVCRGCLNLFSLQSSDVINSADIYQEKPMTFSNLRLKMKYVKN